MESLTYFIQAGVGGPIKIGTSRNVASRRTQLQPGSAFDLYLLATTGANEHALHRQFADLRMRGEWFRPDPELLKFIEGCSPSATTGRKPQAESDGLVTKLLQKATDASEVNNLRSQCCELEITINSLQGNLRTSYQRRYQADAALQSLQEEMIEGARIPVDKRILQSQIVALQALYREKCIVEGVLEERIMLLKQELATLKLGGLDRHPGFDTLPPSVSEEPTTHQEESQAACVETVPSISQRFQSWRRGLSPLWA